MLTKCILFEQQPLPHKHLKLTLVQAQMEKPQSLSQVSGHDMISEETAPQIIEIVQPLPRGFSKYGNMRVLLDTRCCLITLGPDYRLFLPTFCAFVLAALFMIRFVFSCSQNTFFRVLTVFICSLQPTFYLLTALKDPGMIIESVPEDFSESIEARNMKIRECVRCGINVYRFTHHCDECDVCVEGYDHHCPWVSKCIGARNLTVFKIFLGSTTLFMMYSIVALAIGISINLPK